MSLVIQQTDFLAGLEGRQTDVRTAVAAKGITERTISTAADLSLDCKVHLCEIVRSDLDCRQSFVGVGALGRVLSLDFLFETAGAVLACPTAFAGFGAALGSWRRLMSVWEHRLLRGTITHAE